MGYADYDEFEFDQRVENRPRREADLPTYYYHSHFCEMLDFIERHYLHALDAAHRDFLDGFRELTREAQCLYVRLVNRKGVVFSSTRLRYPELGDCRRLLPELRDGGWIGSPNASHLDNVLGHLTRDAIHRALARRYAGLGRSLKKIELMAFVRANCDAGKFIAEACSDQVFVQRRSTAFQYLSYLYFGRIQDGLNRFTMRDLGLVRTSETGDEFEPRFSDRDEARECFFFASRQHGLQKADDYTVDRLFDQSGQWPEPNWASAAVIRDAILLRLGRAYEKRQDVGKALSCYGRAESAQCTERRVRLLFKTRRQDDARALLEQCLDEPRSETEWLFARDLYARKFGSKRTSQLTDELHAADTIELDEAMIGKPERGVIHYYESQGKAAFRTENALWPTLFGLLFWEELFGSGNATLASPFDFLPQALADRTFASRYATEIYERLQMLHDKPRTTRHLLQTSTRHYGKTNGIFRWRRSMIEAILRLVDTASPGSIETVLRNFCRDYRDSRYGYPDLAVFDESGLRFVEVKAEGDQLRRNQLLRLRQLNAAGFNAEIARVRWTLNPETVYVVVDVETTGGRGKHHRITEIGATKVRDGRVIDRFTSLINPQRPIPTQITRLTGISAQMVADAPCFADIADRFEQFMGDAIFVAHNVEFDYGFVASEFQRIGRPFRHAKLCTCASMRKIYPGHRSYSLAALCGRFDIPLQSHHRAQCDADAAAELLLMINEKRAEGFSPGG